MQFSRLRLTGFKSFVEPTEIFIEQGLTGIVGPNGCGKSNLVEALRWVMGETSARKMRGGEMDDVIFGGTENRPARNIAEAILTLNNAQRLAPAPYNESEEIDVARRIERGSGSSYRVNGREVRARDVQMLFADASSGAHSTGLVSQGQIGTIVNSKPTARRHLLEEAAGITGLHSRRHEAELKLRAAETNLERLDDVIGALEEQMRGLKRQARQATRYRNLSGRIRTAEATILYHRWAEASAQLESAKRELDLATEAVTEATRLAADASRRQAETAALLPGLRQTEAETAAALQRLLVARDAIEEEERRLAAVRQDLEGRLSQTEADSAREISLKSEAVESVTALEAEAQEIRGRQTQEAEELEAARQRLSDQSIDVSEAEDALAEATRSLAEREARSAALNRQIVDLEKRRARLVHRRNEVEQERAAATSDLETGDQLDDSRSMSSSARQRLETAREELEAAEGARVGAQAAELERREEYQAIDAQLAKIRAEVSALTELLGIGDPDLWPPMIDAIDVSPGFEAALAAALGDDLIAPIDEAAPIHWRVLAPFTAPTPLPSGATPLGEYAKGPPALARRISQIGLVETDADGARLQGDLAQGQRLVSKTGTLWRWDGFISSPGEEAAAANRLTQRNKLDDLQTSLKDVEAKAGAAQDIYERARDDARATVETERQARDRVWSADRAYQEARDVEAALTQSVADARSRLEALKEASESVAADLAEIDSQVETIRSEEADVGDLEEQRGTIEQKQAALREKRASLIEVRSIHDRLLRDADYRRSRLTQIDAEITSWNRRAANADEQLAQLEERKASVLAELERLERRPAEIAEQRNELLDRISAAEGERSRAADALAEQETALEALDRELKSVQARLADVREDRVRKEAALEQVDQALVRLADETTEKLRCSREEILSSIDVEDPSSLAGRDEAETKLERLLRERDNMGPVNLRAEVEAAELTEKIDTLQTEREDLVGAISRLRQGIAGLNREGRQRLMKAFREVDQHFQRLFARLFTGGSAHLSMTETEDPLEAGLEIMASPPGKKLQTLSLLSGGEQALTALALIFAVFMTNPTPICVLDEVDAPLDDNNVDRFCNMLSEIAEHSSTRFLLVTHHRMTMARMDRLYGVTMGEQGVSQLVSVDLQTAEELRETA